MHSQATAKIIGHVGSVDIKVTNDGNKFAVISIATHEHWTDTDGKVRERTDWHRASTFSAKKVALVEAHVGKGDYLFVDAQLRNRSYQKNGETRYVVDLDITQIGWLNPKEVTQDGDE